MKKLYAPWRTQYASSINKLKKNSDSTYTCPFCCAANTPKTIAADKDTNYVLKQTANCTILLNLYPYNTGHILIVPNNHCSDLQELDSDTHNELMALISKSSALLGTQLNCAGINIGLNLGAASGAGIPEHLHFHLVPRWQGDTNFMPIIAETKVLSFDLGDMYKKLKSSFDSL